MNSVPPGRLMILSGPSCVGKSPLANALSLHYPELWEGLTQLVLYNDRDPRPGEQDGVQYHFRSREEIEALKEKNDFLVIDVRGDLQALDVTELHRLLSQGNVFYEGNPFIATRMMSEPSLQAIDRLTVFMAPLARAEILALKSARPPVNLQEIVADVMRRKLLRRTQKQKGEISLPDLENIERRASSAYQELQFAHHFQHVIPNHDGEDSENWDAFYHPLGDARKALLDVAALLQGETPTWTESWEETLLS